jgi:hypothetical protein
MIMINTLPPPKKQKPEITISQLASKSRLKLKTASRHGGETSSKGRPRPWHTESCHDTGKKQQQQHTYLDVLRNDRATHTDTDTQTKTPTPTPTPTPTQSYTQMRAWGIALIEQSGPQSFTCRQIDMYSVHVLTIEPHDSAQRTLSVPKPVTGSQPGAQM